MLVYGDASRRERPTAMLERIRGWLSEAVAAPVGIVRHDALVTALIEAGELAQGLADGAFEARGGCDGPSSQGDAAIALATALARSVVESWRSGFAALPTFPSAELEILRAADLPATITVRLPEGFAHYCLYPEAYAQAAVALAGRPVRVVGLRSIGTAAVDAPAPFTLRPVGHPFARELALSPEAERRLAEEPDAARAIVDEGPGLSGSSVACVARHLDAAGCRPERIHLFPGHGNGPGPEATKAVRSIWARLPSHVVSFDDLVLRSNDPRHRLEAWVADLVGEPTAPLQEISGGAWRALRCSQPSEWPPVLAWQERRKFLLRTASGTWLLKFAGLGRIGRVKHERARRLAEAGFVPAVAGVRHGFLVERWRDDAASVGGVPDRTAPLGRVAEYLSFRAGEFPSEPARGASMEALFAMARANVGEALGPEAARALATRLPDADRIQAVVRPIETDNRLHAWEWLAAPDALLKADALDHHQGHDLVGCQDVTWDIAGAAVEFALSRADLDELAAAVERVSGRSVVAELLEASSLCYAAFQLGFYTAAGQSAGDPDEQVRLGAAAARYRNRLARDLL